MAMIDSARTVEPRCTRAALPEASLPAIRETLAALYWRSLSRSRKRYLAQELGRLIDLMAAMQRDLVHAEPSGIGMTNVGIAGAEMTGEGVTGQVERTMLALHIDGDVIPSRQQVAELIHLSPRSLSRLLAREGTCWRVIKNRFRCRQAEHLLATTGLSVGRIGERVGYKEPGDFSRAFRQWTGLTPSAYRNHTKGL